ncbi:MAG: hypothetical protein JRJ76_09260 [Deltaproteobacteria bacterium]|nr:hypothetical protein [Deltaproteobacteria bacterium]MBW1846368.1 hypothetical protein [Deltaproteobacteria bacterium]MBW2364233.1 hypothetical protein [Deltaproteobacteria bacterium]
MKNRKIIIVIFIIVLIIPICLMGYKYLFYKNFDRAIKYNDELINNKIPYKQNSNGFILYKSKDEKIVRNIIKKNDLSYIDDLPKISFPDDKNRSYFIKLLEN